MKPDETRSESETRQATRKLSREIADKANRAQSETISGLWSVNQPLTLLAQFIYALGAAAGTFLKSDASGNATWTAIASTDVTGLGALAALNTVSAATIDNRTRSLHFYNGAMQPAAPVGLTRLGTNPDALFALSYPDGGTAYSHLTLQLPQDYVSGGTWKVLYSNDATAANNIRFQLDYLAINAATDVTSAGTTISATVATATANQLGIATIGTSSTGFTAGGHVRVNVIRAGGDALDTFAGVVYVIGLTFEYTADS